MRAGPWLRRGVLHCAKMRGVVVARHFIAGAGAAVKSPACSTSWHCWHARSTYIFERVECSGGRKPRTLANAPEA